MNSIFSTCPQKIFDTIRYLTLRGGDILTLQEEKDENVYIILNGAVNVYNLLSDGSYLPISSYRTGDFIGEMEALLQESALHMVRAAETTEVAILTQENFLKWVKVDNHLCYILLLKAEERLFNRGKQLVLTQQLSKGDLIWLHISRTDTPITKNELVQSTAASSRTVDRQLHRGIEKGWISVCDGKITVLDAKAINAYCSKFPLPIDS